MQKQFTQATGSTAKEVNKQSIARDFGLKVTDVGYCTKNTLVDPFVLLFDPVSQNVFYKGEAKGVVVSTKIEGDSLTLMSDKGSFNCLLAHSYDPVIDKINPAIEKYIIENFKSELVPGVGIILGSTDVGGGKNIPTLSIPNETSQRLFLHKEVTNPDDFSVLQISKNSNYTGGTSGFVSTALNVSSTVTGDGGNTYEWAACFVMNNHMNSKNTSGEQAVPQQVGIYSQANKYGSSATWAACMEINDVSGAGAAIGQEITVKSNGADSEEIRRVGLHISAVSNADNVGSEWGAAFMSSSDVDSAVRFRHVLKSSGLVGDSVIYNDASTRQNSTALIRDVGALVIGVDLSKASYSSSVAIRLAAGQQLQFSPDGALNIKGDVSGLVVTGALNMTNSFTIPGVNTSTGASGGNSGSLPTTVKGYINAKVDGVVVKIPFYGE